MATVAGLIADGRIATDGFVEDTIGLDALPAAIDDLANRRSSPVKLLVDPGAG